jgi:hypothetical protein
VGVCFKVIFLVAGEVISATNIVVIGLLLNIIFLVADELDDASRSIAALTSLGRTDWAQARTDFFSRGVNKESLNIIETAMFHVRFVLRLLYCFFSFGF